MKKRCIYSVCNLCIGVVLLLCGCQYDSASFLASLSPRTHIVHFHETVYSISRKYKVPIQRIITANQLEPPFLLQNGQKLTIPIAQVHTVEKGDTLYSIAKLYGVNFKQLARRNYIKEPWTLSIGQNIYLPATLSKAEYPQKTSFSKTYHQAKPPQKKYKKSQNKNIVLSTPSLSGTFMFPVSGEIISHFGKSKRGYQNDGINIKTQQGKSFKAAENGVVAYTGNELKGFGNLILIKHKNGWITAYAHADRIMVHKGQTVKKGQTLGTVGRTGNVKSPQLHFELRKNTKAVNPMKYLKR